MALTNEHAGSDGDIFTHSFKLLGLGPLVGKRTWGGVIGISPRHALVDGSLTTQPEYAFWFDDVGWSVENYGTDPDVEVDIRPQDHVAGRDPQLDMAVQLALDALQDAPPAQRRPHAAPPAGAADAAAPGARNGNGAAASRFPAGPEAGSRRRRSAGEEAGEEAHPEAGG